VILSKISMVSDRFLSAPLSVIFCDGEEEECFMMIPWVMTDFFRHVQKSGDDVELLRKSFLLIFCYFLPRFFIGLFTLKTDPESDC